MKVCVAQTRPVKGDIYTNVEHHKRLIELAVSSGADLIVFPELSLTGYEPTLAEGLATTPEDSRFSDFQDISNARQITIGVGVPTKSSTGICISMLLFGPYQQRKVYSKKYLHMDEEPFFVSGQNFTFLEVKDTKLSLAICYEISVPAHAEVASKSGAEIYVASVAKSVGGIDKALQRLSVVAAENSMTVLMANSLGLSDGMECAGKSSIWNNKGILLGQLDGAREGIILVDTSTQELIEKQLEDDLLLH